MRFSCEDGKRRAGNNRVCMCLERAGAMCFFWKERAGSLSWRSRDRPALSDNPSVPSSKDRTRHCHCRQRKKGMESQPANRQNKNQQIPRLAIQEQSKGRSSHRRICQGFATYSVSCPRGVPEKTFWRNVFVKRCLEETKIKNNNQKSRKSDNQEAIQKRRRIWEWRE